MVKQFSLQTVLRLFCLLSVTQNGLKQEYFDHLRRVFVMCYGYQEIPTLINLQEAGLFRVKSKDVIDWNKLKREYRLITEEVKIDKPTEISYVYGGYAPLSIRFVEMLMEKEGFRNMPNCKCFQADCARVETDPRALDLPAQREGIL